MFGFNNDAYELSSERELSEILGNFSSDYIYDVVDNYIDRRYEFAVNSKPNIVNVFKVNFDNLRSQYTMDIENINNIERDTYINIIHKVCDNCGVSFNNDTEDNLYLLALTLYDFLVCKFNNHMVDFLIKFILNEKDSIYSTLELEDFKKSKDSATIYNKKIIGDMKLAIINSNLPKVLNYIASIDINMNTLLESAYQPQIAYLISSNFEEVNNIYSDFMNTIINNDILFPDYITDLKIKFQGVNINEN